MPRPEGSEAEPLRHFVKRGANSVIFSNNIRIDIKRNNKRFTVIYDLGIIDTVTDNVWLPLDDIRMRATGGTR